MATVTKLQASDGPSQRWNAAATKAPDGRIFVFGGSMGLTYYSDVHALSRKGSRRVQWKKIETAPSRTGAPGPSAQHSIVSVGKLIIAFGGVQISATNEVYRLDLETLMWTRIRASGEAIEPRCMHAAAAPGGVNAMYVFGGKGHDDKFFGDLLMLQTDTFSWKRINAKGDCPSARAGATMVSCGAEFRSLCLFGGFVSDDTFRETVYDDVYILDIGNGRYWRKIECSTARPCGRYGHGMCALSETRILIVGGYTGTTYLNDAWVLNIESGEWTCVLENNVNSDFTPRRGLVLQSLSESHAIAMFGGQCKTLPNRTFEYYDDMWIIATEDAEKSDDGFLARIAAFLGQDKSSKSVKKPAKKRKLKDVPNRKSHEDDDSDMEYAGEAVAVDPPEMSPQPTRRCLFKSTEKKRKTRKAAAAEEEERKTKDTKSSKGKENKANSQTSKKVEKSKKGSKTTGKKGKKESTLEEEDDVETEALLPQRETRNRKRKNLTESDRDEEDESSVMNDVSVPEDGTDAQEESNGQRNSFGSVSDLLRGSCADKEDNGHEESRTCNEPKSTQIKSPSTDITVRVRGTYGAEATMDIAKDSTTYTITVRTSDSMFAGTDARVFVDVEGENGQPLTFWLDEDGEDRTFARGVERTFIRHGHYIGPIYRVRAGHDNSGHFPGWKLDYIRIGTAQDGDMVHAEFGGQWLKGDTAVLSAESVTKCVPFHVFTKTSNKINSGTDAIVSITLLGEEGMSALTLNGRGKPLDRGRVDEFLCYGPRVGVPHALLLSQDGSGAFSSWRCEWISISDDEHGIFTAHVQRVVKKPDGVLQFDLVRGDAEATAPQEEEEEEEERAADTKDDQSTRLRNRNTSDDNSRVDHVVAPSGDAILTHQRLLATFSTAERELSWLLSSFESISARNETARSLQLAQILQAKDEQDQIIAALKAENEELRALAGSGNCAEELQDARAQCQMLKEEVDMLRSRLRHERDAAQEEFNMMEQEADQEVPVMAASPAIAEALGRVSSPLVTPPTPEPAAAADAAVFSPGDEVSAAAAAASAAFDVGAFPVSPAGTRDRSVSRDARSDDESDDSDADDDDAGEDNVVYESRVSITGEDEQVGAFLDAAQFSYLRRAFHLQQITYNELTTLGEEDLARIDSTMTIGERKRLMGKIKELQHDQQASGNSVILQQMSDIQRIGHETLMRTESVLRSVKRDSLIVCVDIHEQQDDGSFLPVCVKKQFEERDRPSFCLRVDRTYRFVLTVIQPNNSEFGISSFSRMDISGLRRNIDPPEEDSPPVPMNTIACDILEQNAIRVTCEWDVSAHPQQGKRRLLRTRTPRKGERILAGLAASFHAKDLKEPLVVHIPIRFKLYGHTRAFRVGKTTQQAKRFAKDMPKWAKYIATGFVFVVKNPGLMLLSEAVASLI